MLWQREGNKSVGTHPEGNSWWAKAGGPWWAICGRPFAVGQIWWANQEQVWWSDWWSNWWSICSGPKLVGQLGAESGGPFRALRGRSSAGQLRSSPGVQAWCPSGGPNLGGNRLHKGRRIKSVLPSTCTNQ